MSPAPSLHATGGSRRLLGPDLVRGLCFLLMMCDHMPPSPVHHLTYEPVGFVSAAEGFVFVSGLVSGLVMTRRWLRSGLAAVANNAWRRCRLIYAYHLAVALLVLGLACAGWTWTSAWREMFPINAVGVPATVGLCATLLYQPWFMNILPMYICFVALTPLFLWLLHRRPWALLGASALLWLVAQHPPHWPWQDIEWIDLGYFSGWAWQLLFIGGFALGHLHARARLDWLKPAPKWIALCAVVALGLLIVRKVNPTLESGLPLKSWWPFTRVNLGPVRLLNFVVVAYLVFCLCSKTSGFLQRNRCAQAVIRLGQHGLPVYATSIVFSYVGLLLKPAWGELPVAAQIVITLGFATLLWVPARVHEQMARAARPMALTPAWNRA